MSFEIYRTDTLKGNVGKVKELLCQTYDVASRVVGYPGCSVDTSPSEIFNTVVYIDVSPEAVTQLQKSGYTAICTTYKDHTDMYDLVIEQRSQGTFEDIMKLVKPGGFILSEENYGIPLALEKSDEFVFIKNISQDNKKKPIKRHQGTLGNGGTDYFLYQKLVSGQKKKKSIVERISQILNKINL